MNKLRSPKLLIICFIFVVGIIVWFKLKLISVPGEEIAKKFLVNKVGKTRINSFMEQYRIFYRALSATTRQPENRILRIHLNQAILPVVAFYQVLLPINDGNREKTIREIETVIREWILSRTRNFISPLRYLPRPFKIFRPGFEIVMKLFPPAGFDIDYLEKSDQRIAFNIKGCYYLNTLTRYSLPELTPVFCAADEAMAELFPPSIEFHRTQTLGKGGELCDFRYCRKQGDHIISS